MVPKKDPKQKQLQNEKETSRAAAVVHAVIVTNAAAVNYPDEGEYQLSWNTIIEFRGPCERYLAACPFPEPARSEQFELSVLPVPSPAR